MKLLMMIVVLSLGVAPAFADADGDDNAALQYWQGIVLITDSTKKTLENWDTVEIKGDVLNDVRDNNPRLEYLHAGAAMPRCDWGLDMRKGPALLLPHLGESRDLARLAFLRARYRFEQGRAQAGVDDVLDTFELAKDLGDTPILISLLVRYSIEQQAIDTLAAHLPLMDQPALDRLAKALETLPAPDQLGKVWSAEPKYFVDPALDRVRQLEKQSAGDQNKWVEGVLAMGMYTEGHPMRAEDVPPPAKLIEAMEAIKHVMADLEKITDLPPAEQDVRLDEMKQRYKSYALAMTLLPDQNKVFATRRRWQARHAMLDAAVAVQREGEAVLKDKKYADPFGDGPFESAKSGNGFELRSKLVVEGKPVTLTAGKTKS